MTIESSDGGFTITPTFDLFMDWSNERMDEFKATFPKEWEALKRGYVVEVPALPEEYNPVSEKVVERRKELHRTPIE